MSSHKLFDQLSKYLGMIYKQHLRGCLVRYLPINLKWNEKESILLLNCENHAGISIGDLCVVANHWRWEYLERDQKKGKFLPHIQRVLAFYEVEGKYFGSPVKEIYCALGTVGDDEERICCEGGKVLLFWAKGLKKAECV